VAPSGDEDDLNAFAMGSPEGCEVSVRYVKFGVEQSTVDVNGYETKGIGGHG
jgi:hypothetical protein